MEQQSRRNNVIVDFFAGLAVAKNRRNFFGALFISYGFVAVVLLCASIIIEQQPKPTIIIPMVPSEEQLPKGIEI